MKSKFKILLEWVSVSALTFTTFAGGLLLWDDYAISHSNSVSESEYFGYQIIWLLAVIIIASPVMCLIEEEEKKEKKNKK